MSWSKVNIGNNDDKMRYPLPEHRVNIVKVKKLGSIARNTIDGECLQYHYNPPLTVLPYPVSILSIK